MVKHTRHVRSNKTTLDGEKIIEQYYNYITKEQVTITNSYLDAYAPQIIEECLQNEKLFTITALLVKLGLRVFPYYKWVSMNETFEMAHNVCLLILGSRREQRALERDPAGKVFQHMQHEYDEAWDKANKYHAKLKEDTIATKIPDVIEIPVFNTCVCNKDEDGR